MLAGMTNYSHQSLEDMIRDLQAWVESLREVRELFDRNIRVLEEARYWRSLPADVMGLFGYADKFYETGEREISDIAQEIQHQEIQAHHVARIRSLAQTAADLNSRYGEIWHGSERFKDCGDPDFRLLEELYQDGRGMAADLIDLDNLAARLEDFIGKKSRVLSVDEAGTAPSLSAEFVDSDRIEELRGIIFPQFDLTKLVRLCEELNSCYANGCYFAVAMLTRAVLDHVPPVFRFEKFSEVANSYSGTRSFKQSMKHLDSSLRNIADAHLHVRIRDAETLPTKTQVNFSNDLDVLLAEITRILKK